MFLISQVESIGYLKNVDVNENLEDSVSILFHIKSIKPLYYPHCIHKTMIYLLWRFYHDFNNVLVSLFLVKKTKRKTFPALASQIIRTTTTNSYD